MGVLELASSIAFTTTSSTGPKTTFRRRIATTSATRENERSGKPMASLWSPLLPLLLSGSLNLAPRKSRHHSSETTRRDHYQLKKPEGKLDKRTPKKRVVPKIVVLQLVSEVSVELRGLSSVPG